MPYHSKQVLPDNVKNVCLPAQEIYKKRLTAPGINIRIKTTGAMTPAAKRRHTKVTGRRLNSYERR